MCNLISVDMETADFDPKYDIGCMYLISRKKNNPSPKKIKK